MDRTASYTGYNYILCLNDVVQSSEKAKTDENVSGQGCRFLSVCLADHLKNLERKRFHILVISLRIIYI